MQVNIRENLNHISRRILDIDRDFNDLLTGILANAELAMKDLPENSQSIKAMRRVSDIAIGGADLITRLKGISLDIQAEENILKESKKKHRRTSACP